jgi:hypothetical protein
MSSNQSNIYKLLLDFKDLFDELRRENSIKLTPHYITYPHPLFDESDLFDENQKKELFKDCYGKGKYCVPNHGKSKDTIDDKFIIEENIKQKCIYNYSMSINQIEIYYNYMLTLYKQCILEDKFNEICSSTVDKVLETNNETVKNCIENSFEFTGKGIYITIIAIR